MPAAQLRGCWQYDGMTVKNPCVGICKFDDATSLCKACFRTREERKTWKAVSEESRIAVIALRPERERELIAAGSALAAPDGKKQKKGQKKKDAKIKQKRETKNKKDKKKKKDKSKSKSKDKKDKRKD